MRGKNKEIRILLCVLLLVAGVVGFEIFGVPAMKKYQTYQKAEQFLQDGKFEEAKTMYWSLGEYRNAQEQRKACDYGMAEQLMKKKDYESAKMLYEELKTYVDTKDKIKQCDYKIAEGYRKEKSYEEAAKIFKELGSYKESAQKLLDCKNGMAKCYFEKYDYQKAYELYDELTQVNYKGAKLKRQETLQKLAHKAYDQIIENEKNSNANSYSISYAYYDISEDGVDEMFLYTPCESSGVKIVTYKDGQVEEIGTMIWDYPYMRYSPEANILFADAGSCGCSNNEIFQYKDGKIESVADIHATDYKYLKDELPKGKFKKKDFIYRYTETDKEPQYFTIQEFEAMFQKKYKVAYDDLWELYEPIEWNYESAEW